jgi:nicotinate-nucleotide pyrophosphorylase (carboxylating)
MNYIKEPDIKDIIINALKEDIGAGDITTQRVILRDKIVKAILLAKENCVVCGLGVVASVFRTQDKNIRFKICVKEGEFVKNGKIIARLTGKAGSILTAERVALNFLCHLSGVASMTRKFVKAVRPYKAKIMDTRKTTPGLRILEKYAVRIGGGFNHRFSLDEMMLIKDNHIKVAGGIAKLRGIGGEYKLEIEVKNLPEFKKAIKLKPDVIMLDNMSIKDIRKAVQIRNYRLPITDYRLPKLEASGGITLKNAKKIASCGPDMISIGALTHSVSSANISLEIL